jgi:hypothetical protein
MKRALGAASSAFVNASLAQLVAAARLPCSGISEIAVNASLAFIEGAKPRIADCTGLTPPYVNRMLQTMRVKRLIRFENKILEILDRIELAKIAGFDPTYIEGWGQGSSTFGSTLLAAR